MNYEDNPEANLKFLRSLSKDQLKMYISGYKLACVQMREALTKGKLDLLNYLLETKEGPRKAELARTVDLLDKYEELIYHKEDKLKSHFPEILGHPKKV